MDPLTIFMLLFIYCLGSITTSMFFPTRYTGAKVNYWALFWPITVLILMFFLILDKYVETKNRK